MAKRIKSNGPAITTRAQMERVVADICELTIFKDRQMAAMDKRLMEIREEYEGTLGKAQEELDAKMAMARDWAEANPGEFSGRKSIEMVHGTVGWRTGTPKLKLLTGWTWNRVLEFLVINKLVDFIRSKQEVDKEVILANRDCIKEETLRQIGVKVVQEESFYVDPKRDSAETVVQG